MAEPDVIGALRNKRAEMAGVVSLLGRQLSRQQADLTHLDATLRLFDPTIRLTEIRPRRRYVRNTWFRHGECLRLIYDLPARHRTAGHDAQACRTDHANQSHTRRRGAHRDLVQRTLLASLNRAKETIARTEVGGGVAWRLI